MNILLVDDHKLFAKSLQLSLSNFNEINCIKLLQNIDSIEDVIKKDNFDIVLMDINLNNISSENGLDISKRILKLLPNLKIIILTGYDLPVYQYEAYKIGIKGFVDKNIEPNHFFDIIKSVYLGSEYFKSKVISINDLTEREKEVLNYMSKGYKRKYISTLMYISERTLSNHIQSILNKLDVDSSIEAITKAIKLGYITY